MPTFPLYHASLSTGRLRSFAVAIAVFALVSAHHSLAGTNDVGNGALLGIGRFVSRDPHTGTERRQLLAKETFQLLATPEENEVASFLVENMPNEDIKAISPQYLRENVVLALKAWHASPWKNDVPWSVFLNYIAPYASITETRDRWRPLFFAMMADLIKDSMTVEDAALKINRELWGLWDPPIHFVADQAPKTMSPFEVISARNASCTGLSLFLIDALRAAGIPARLTGIPRWNTPEGGNHNWVEVLVNGSWHFMGSAEPDSAGLDHAWFYPNPVQSSIPGGGVSSVYAASWGPTTSGLHFPLYWNLSITWVHADDVTDMYMASHEPLVPQVH